MEPRKTFVMSIEFWAGAKVLDAPQKAVLLQAIMAFNGADCEMPEMDQATAGVFGMMEPFFNASRVRYEDICNKRREAGRKGGLSGKAKKAKASKANHHDLEHDYDHDLDHDNKHTPYSPPQGEQGVAETPSPKTSSPKEENPKTGEEPQAEEPTQDVKADLSHGNPAWKEFCYLYSLWPVQQGKEKAWREYAALKARHLVPESSALADIIERFKAEDRRWKRGYAPMMANWLHDRRWDDVPEKVPVRSYAPDENGRTPYVNENDQDYSSGSAVSDITSMMLGERV